jgi:hypothetical protein
MRLVKLPEAAVCAATQLAKNEGTTIYPWWLISERLMRLGMLSKETKECLESKNISKNISQQIERSMRKKECEITNREIGQHKMYNVMVIAAVSPEEIDVKHKSLQILHSEAKITSM